MSSFSLGQTPKSGAVSPSSNVSETTDQGFVTDVIEASRQQPVLVDFWAPWCGPCKTLGPLIERLVEEQAGKVKLVKINIDENPSVAGQLGVRSIPAVFAFDKGQPVDGFMGALPEGQLRQFIEKILSGTDEGKSLNEAIEQADQLLQAGDLGNAAQLYAAVLQHDETNIKAIGGLARCYLANGDPERARETLDLAPVDKRTDAAWTSVDTALQLQANAPDTDALRDAQSRVDAAPHDHEARHALAEQYAAAGRNREAMEELLRILSQDLNWNEGKAKETLLTVFEAAGPKDPVTIEGRRRLSSLMFA